MELKPRDEFAAELGEALIANADKLKLFMPNCQAETFFVWNGQRFTVTLILDDTE